MKANHLPRRLLAWFRKNARPLPWRADRDPYRIWLSEVMLQQTQVATVIPYFHRFLERFPNLPALAAADEEDVLRQWEGLGYYRRARALWQAARILYGQGHATIPDEPDLVRSLPGFGRYTANAVLSQAFQRRLPIVEANSQRVLCRVFGIEQDARASALQKQLWQHAESLLPAKRAGDFNQALMELGALVCTPANPKCGLCPIAGACQAKLQGMQHQIPRRAKTSTIVQVEEIAVVVRKADKVLLLKRGDAGRWAGMWEVPHHEIGPLESHADAARRLLAGIGLKANVIGEIGVIRHSVTRFRIRMTCLEVKYRSGRVRLNGHADATWVHPHELADYPLASPQRRIAAHV